MIRYLRKEKFKVFVCVKLVGLGGFCETVKNSTGLCAFIGLDHNEVLPADSEWPDGLFGIIVIHGYISVLKELPEVLFLIDAVSQSFPDGAVVGNLIIFGFCPLEINVNPLLKMLLTLFLSVGWEMCTR